MHIFSSRTANGPRPLESIIQLEIVERAEVAHWCCAKGDFCDEHLLFQLVWRSGLDPGYVTQIGVPEALAATRPHHGFYYSYLRTGERSPKVSESRREYLCPHLATAMRLLPKESAYPKRLLDILTSANCNSAATAP